MTETFNRRAFKILFFCCFLVVFASSGFGQVNHEINTKTGIKSYSQLLYNDEFSSDSQKWFAEFENPEGSSITIGNGLLDINSAGGATVWFKTKLSGNIIISYKVLIVDKGGKNDRVSDLNAFWMATNPKNQNIFMQDGKFSSYDQLHLYYAGIGGHDNNLTRFRKYQGGIGKDVLKEYADAAHLIVGNNLYQVKIVCNNGLTQYFLNDILYWEFKDSEPYKEGYFGFRTTKSHQQMSSFKVFSIQ